MIKWQDFKKMGIYMFRKQADKPNCSLLRINKAYKQNQMCREKKKKLGELHTASFPIS